MSTELHGSPERLSRGADDHARELLRSANVDVPSNAVRRAALENVLSEYRSRHANVWLWATAAAVCLGFGVGYATFARPAHSPHTALAREPGVVSGRSAPSGAPSASAQVPEELQRCTPAARGSGKDPLIDDFEDGDTRVLHVDRRAGSWATFNDGTAVQRPSVGVLAHADRIPGGRASSHFGLHTSGGKFKTWGAGIASDLTPRRCYDASAYAGISFWARGHGKFNVVAKMTQVVAEEYGGSCTHDCFDGHHLSIPLTSNWEQHFVRWEELSQSGFGIAVPFDPRSLLSFEFQVPAEDTPFDFWIDDVSFILR